MLTKPEGFCNLISLFREFSSLNGSDIEEDSFFYSASNDSSIWPYGNILKSPVDVDSLNNLIGVISDLKGLLFVLEEDLKKIDFKKSGYRPLDIWYSMKMNLFSYQQNHLKNNMVIHFVDDENKLEKWLMQINDIFFMGKILNPIFFQSCMNVNSYEFVNFIVDNQSVGSAFLYYRESSVGLYFFSINWEFRNLGLAKDALRLICNYISEKGSASLVLQSTSIAKKLYNEFGLVNEQKIYLLDKI